MVFTGRTSTGKHRGAGSQWCPTAQWTPETRTWDRLTIHGLVQAGYWLWTKEVWYWVIVVTTGTVHSFYHWFDETKYDSRVALCTSLSRSVPEWSEPCMVTLAHYTTPTLVHHYTTVHQSMDDGEYWDDMMMAAVHKAHDVPLQQLCSVLMLPALFGLLWTIGHWMTRVDWSPSHWTARAPQPTTPSKPSPIPDPPATATDGWTWNWKEQS